MPKGLLVGILIVAHGGSSTWNKAVQQAVAQAQLTDPVEIVFGMGMDKGEVNALQNAINSLEKKGVEKVAVLPLLVSAHSEVYRQWTYLLGVDNRPGFPEITQKDALFPVKYSKPLRMGRPLSEYPNLDLVLLHRALGLSENPSEETVLLVAHGPNDDRDNETWLKSLSAIGASLKQRGRFKDVRVLSLREDAPEPVRNAAKEALRQAVQDASAAGSAILVPVLVAPGGIEDGIPKRLQGLNYRFDGQVLLPHPAISRWIRDEVTRLKG